MSRKGAAVSAVDREADRIADLMRRLAALERVGHVHASGGSTNFPPGAVVFSVATTPDPGWALLDGSTIVNGQTLYPELWARIPAGMKSGANIVLPDGRGRTFIGSGLGTSPTTLTNRVHLSAGGVETVALTAAQTAVKGHGHTFTGSGVTSGAGSSHSHTFTGNAVASGPNSVGHTHDLSNHFHDLSNHSHSLSNHQHDQGTHSHGEVVMPGTLGGTFARIYGDFAGGGGWSVAIPANYGAGSGVGNPAYTQNASPGYTSAPSNNNSGTPSNNSSTTPSNNTSGGVSANHSHTTTATGTNSNESAHTHSVTAAGTVSTLADGAAGSAHDNMQPWLALNAFIKLD